MVKEMKELMERVKINIKSLASCYKLTLSYQIMIIAFAGSAAY
jgi:hypothetical protein